MPPKKNKSKQKQLKTIQSRLMKISLKIENYIYKHKPISLQDAKLYIQKVATYKHHCGENIRILQVIEKLNRQLKAIIEEEQYSTNYNVQEVNENSIQTCLMSPTYSVNNDDIGQSTVKEVGERCDNIRQQDYVFDIDEPAVTINQCSDEDINEEIITGKEKHDDLCKDIQRSLSQLTIQLVKQNELHKEAVSAIVGIIPHVTIVDVPTPKNNNLMLKDIDIQQREADFVAPWNKTYQYQDKIAYVNLIASNNNPSTLTKDLAATSKLEDKKSAENLPKTKRTKKTKKNESNNNKEIPRKRRNNKCKIQHNNNVTAINTNLANNSYRAKIVSKKQYIHNSNNTDLSMNNNNSKIMCPPCPKNNIYIKAVEVISHNQIEHIGSVYNKNVENDLSWIENIRYVREVAPDETDHKLTYTDDRFWDTFDLPANWNDQDFSY